MAGKKKMVGKKKVVAKKKVVGKKKQIPSSEGMTHFTESLRAALTLLKAEDSAGYAWVEKTVQSLRNRIEGQYQMMVSFWPQIP